MAFRNTRAYKVRMIENGKIQKYVGQVMHKCIIYQDSKMVVVKEDHLASVWRVMAIAPGQAMSMIELIYASVDPNEAVRRAMQP